MENRQLSHGQLVEAKTLQPTPKGADLTSTIFEDYDTVVFDLDGTLWDVFTPDGRATGAYQAVPPFQLQSKYLVRALNGVIIRLQEGAWDVLNALDQADKNLGIVSRSEIQGVPFAAQPATMLLKIFRIYRYFNSYIELKWGCDKADYVKAVGKTLYIDDDNTQLQSVNALGPIDVLNRRSFGTWSQLLAPKQDSLNLNMAERTGL
jgi:predicted phosphatase